MPGIRPVLKEFAAAADEWFENRSFVKDRYRYFQNFFRLENLRQADWEDFQTMGKKIHALSTNPLVHAKAFGDPNHPIDHYRNSFEYLAHGDDPLPNRLDQVCGNEDPYGIKYLSESSFGELAGQLFADEYLIYNSRSQEGLEYVGIEPPLEGNFGNRFIQFTEVAYPVVEAYRDIVGPRMDIPLHLEVDQFLSWVYETKTGQNEESQRVWLISPGREAEFWDYWQQNDIITIGWDELGDLRGYATRDEIEDGAERVSHIDARACWEFSREMEIGDFVVVKGGKTSILGAGIVTSAYRFEENDKKRNRNQRGIRWIRTGEWETQPRAFPRSEWDRAKKERGDWRDEPRILPRKTLTEIGATACMTAELEILLGLDGKAEASLREPLSIDEELLDRAVEQFIQPEVEAGVFRDGEEAYLHDKKLPQGQKNLLSEALAEDPVQHAKQALGDGPNPLDWREKGAAENFFEYVPPGELRKRIEMLLRGDQPLSQRLESFLDWGASATEAEGTEINGTVASYLLAMECPTLYAFCKPTVYREAAKALLGPDAAYTSSNEAKRIVHASRLYGEVLRKLRRDYDLPLYDLLYVHSAFFKLSSLSGSEPTWESLSANGTADETDRRYFWLNCSPERWDPRDADVGEEQAFTSHTENGNPRRRKESFRTASPGDRAVAYVTSPIQRVVAEFKVTQGLGSTPDDEGHITLKKTQNLPDGPTHDKLRAHSELSESVPLGARGTLFPLEHSHFEAIVGFGPEPYSIEDASRNLFYDQDDVYSWVDRLKKRKNLILQGPPGVGKTYVSKRLAFALMGEMATSRVQMVQLHQSYTYEDFIRGYRPQPDGGFYLQDGIFFRFCERAKDDLQNDYVFIIDEINRGNLSKIFGELMMLIEPDKRGPEEAVPLAYQREESDPFGRRFYVPENVHLLGMMNTADRSLAMVDYALRRRFAFVEMEPRFDSNRFEQFLHERGAEEDMIERIRGRLQALNEEITNDSNLGEGFRIGHSYFCPSKEEIPNERWYREVVRREVAPLLKEYWFDDPETAEEHVEALLG